MKAGRSAKVRAPISDAVWKRNMLVAAALFWSPWIAGFAASIIGPDSLGQGAFVPVILTSTLLQFAACATVVITATRED